MYRLVDPVLGELVLTRDNGFFVQEFDRAAPAPRAVVTERVNANGTDDTTAFYGASSVSLRLMLVPQPGITRQSLLDRLRAFASPARRPVLYYKDPDDLAERRILLRGDTSGAPIDNPFMAVAQVQWACPDGVAESADEVVVEVPVAAFWEPGRSYPRTYPMSYPSLAAGFPVINDGTEPAAPVVRMWGPVTGPSLVKVSTGDQFVLKDALELTADQYAEVDVARGTVTLNGRPDEPLTGMVDFLASTFWWLGPGTTGVRYDPTTAGAGAHAEIVYRHTWI